MYGSNIISLCGSHFFYYKKRRRAFGSIYLWQHTWPPFQLFMSYAGVSSVYSQSRSAVKRWPLSYLWAEQRWQWSKCWDSELLTFLSNLVRHFSRKMLKLSTYNFWILRPCQIFCNSAFVAVIFTSKGVSYTTFTASDIPVQACNSSV